MTAPAHVVLERVTHVTPFGIGLWDVVRGRLVTEGLRVQVHALAGTRVSSTTIAQPTRGGLFAAHDIEPLRRFEAGDEWATTSPAQPWLVEVRDDGGQFIPFVLHSVLPTHGLARPACADDLWPVEPASPPHPGSASSPPASHGAHSSPPHAPLASPPAPRLAPSYVPLFSAPARAVPAGRAAVRATFVRRSNGAPAAGAVLEVRLGTHLLARGIADHRGAVVAMFAYPEPVTPSATSPGGGSAPSVSLTNQWWPLGITVRYRATHATYPAGAPDALPDLCELLGQPLAAVHTASPLAPLTEATLRYGEELVLGAESGAELFLSPA